MIFPKKDLLLILFAMLIFFFIVVIVAFSRINSEAKKSIFNKSKLQVRNIVQNVENELGSLSDMTSIIATSFDNNVENDSSFLEYCDAVFSEIIRETPNISAIWIVADDSILLGEKSDSFFKYKDTLFRSFYIWNASQHYNVDKILSPQINLIAKVNVSGNAEFSKLYPNKDSYSIMRAEPIIFNGNIIGVLCVELSFSFLKKQIISLSSLDENLVFLFSENSDFSIISGKERFLKNENCYEKYISNFKKIIDRNDSDYYSGEVWLTQMGEKTFQVVLPMTISQISQSWFLSINYPLSDIHKPFIILRWLLIFAGFVIVVFFILLFPSFRKAVLKS